MPIVYGLVDSRFLSTLTKVSLPTPLFGPLQVFTKSYIQIRLIVSPSPPIIMKGWTKQSERLCKVNVTTWANNFWQHTCAPFIKSDYLFSNFF
jgi:hypothetical protein